MKKIDISLSDLQDYENLLHDFENQSSNILIDAVSYLYLYTHEEYFNDEKYVRVFRIYSELRKSLIMKFTEKDSLRRMKALMSVRRKQIDWLEQELQLAMIEIEACKDNTEEKERLICRYVRLFNREILDWKISKDDFTS